MHYLLKSSLNGHCMNPQLVWADMEAVLAADVDESAAERRAEEETLLRGGRSDYPTTLAACIEGVHPSSVTCVRALSACDMVVTGSGDHRHAQQIDIIQIYSFAGEFTESFTRF